MEILLPGFCAALILVGIHAYLGIHVIERGVIFVDLAMAQSAVLGTLIAFLFLGKGPEHPMSYAFSLGFTLLHAGFFALGRNKKGRVPEEAIIGLTYAILSATSILLLDRSPHGADRVRDMLAGNVLWVSWSTVGQTAVLYGLVGILHLVWHSKFLSVSQDPDLAAKNGLNVVFWDFLFYASFGVIITSSVAIGGVLLVFTLLVAPAMVGILFANSLRSRLLISYGFGFLVTVVGFLVSYLSDLPTGATVVVLFGVMLLPIGSFFMLKKIKGKSSKWGLGFLLALVFLFSATYFAKQFFGHPTSQHLHQHDSNTTDKKATHEKKHSLSATKQKKDVASQKIVNKTPNGLQWNRWIRLLQGKEEASFLERKEAFESLCKHASKKSPACPFQGDLLKMDDWFQKQSHYFQEQKVQSRAPLKKKETKR